jgi:hypothetical protein
MWEESEDHIDDAIASVVYMPPTNVNGAVCDDVVYALFLNDAFLTRMWHGRVFRDLFAEAVAAARLRTLDDVEEDAVNALARILKIHGNGVVLCGHCAANKRRRLHQHLFLVFSILAIFFTVLSMF